MSAQLCIVNVGKQRTFSAKTEVRLARRSVWVWNPQDRSVAWGIPRGESSASRATTWGTLCGYVNSQTGIQPAHTKPLTPRHLRRNRRHSQRSKFPFFRKCHSRVAMRVFARSLWFHVTYKLYVLNAGKCVLLVL